MCHNMLVMFIALLLLYSALLSCRINVITLVKVVKYTNSKICVIIICLHNLGINFLARTLKNDVKQYVLNED